MTPTLVFKTKKRPGKKPEYDEAMAALSKTLKLRLQHFERSILYTLEGHGRINARRTLIEFLQSLPPHC